MKYQVLFCLKNNEKEKMLSAAVVIVALRVKCFMKSHMVSLFWSCPGILEIQTLLSQTRNTLLSSSVNVKNKPSHVYLW